MVRKEVAYFCHLSCDPPPLPFDIRPEIDSVLKQFPAIFDDPKQLPPNRGRDHHIELIRGAQPVNVNPYRYPYFQKNEIERLTVEMLQQGLIRPSTSPFLSPVLLVRKKDGMWRFCVDYRTLNSIMVQDRFPIPTMDELVNELHDAKIFSKLDLRVGYHQIRIVEEDIHKSAFRTDHGHYKFTMMPFGLTNVPAIFQATMNQLLAEFLRKFVLVFFDDILIYSL